MSTKTEGSISFEYNFKSRQLKSCTWTPQGDIKALAFLSHGYGERLTPYYDGIGSTGAQQGILVFGHDHTGHGLSEGDRVQVESEEEYVRPVLEHCGKYKTQYPDLPLFIIGHSMGGLITVLSAMEDAEKAVPVVDGIVLVGPLIEADPEVATPIKIFLARILKSVLPGMQLGKIQRSAITSDQTWIETMEKDEDRWHGSFKALHSYVLITRLEKLQTELKKLTVPLFILHGEKDSICTISGSQRLHDQAQSKDKTIKIVENALHNLIIESEPIKSQVYQDIWDWVNQRVNNNKA